MTRLKGLRIERHLSQQEVADSVGVERSLLSRYESGAINPPLDMILKFSTFFDVSTDYLLGKDDARKFPANIFPVGEVVTMSILSSVRGGYDGRAVVEFSDEKAAFLRSAFKGYPPEDCSVLRVRGGSMYPKIEDGDLVLVHRTPSVDSGRIAVIIYNSDEATIKRVRYEPGEDWLELIPINPEYETRRITGPDLEICRVFGEVIAMQRSF